LDIAASLQVLERRYHVSGEVFERRLLPVARRAAHASLVVPQNGHAVADEKAGVGQQILAILSARRMDEYHGGVRPWGVGLISVPASWTSPLEKRTSSLGISCTSSVQKQGLWRLFMYGLPPS
jgi:hypothetical protein